MNNLALALMALRMKRTQRKTDTPFPQQDRFVDDESQFVAALTTRRAGKSTGFARRYYNTMIKYPGCLCPHIGLTRESTKNIMWPILQELNDRGQWNAKFHESNLSMELPNGSRVQLFGADMKNFIRRLRGIKTPGAGVDEAQEFGEHLQTLVDDILTPATADYIDGWIGLGGTPGPIPRGYFYDVTQGGLYGYSVHRWGIYDNPFMPDPAAFVEKLKKRQGWDETHPTLLREYKGLWVLDTESLLIKYSEDRNHYDELPNPIANRRWTYILGVDLGYRDSDALAVLAWGEWSPNIYLVEEVVTQGQDITQLSNQIEAMIKKYDVAKIVMDEGALGKKIAEEIRRRKHIPVQPAEKQRKFENVAFLNDYLRAGKFKAKKQSRFAQDSMQVQIDYEKTTPDRIVVKKGFHSDIIDAVLYSFKESPAFTFQAQPAKPKYGTPEWGRQEEDAMYEAALEAATASQDPAQGFDWENWGT